MVAANIVNTITINIQKSIETKPENGETKHENGEIPPIPPPTHPNTRIK